jgi:hypothetical protein
MLNDDIHNLFFPPYIDKVMKSRIMEWAEHVAQIREIRNTCRFVAETSRGVDNSAEEPSE